MPIGWSTIWNSVAGFWTQNSWFSTLDLQIKFSRSREVSWILWVLVGSVDVDKYVWHVKLWTTDVVRNWRTRQLFENSILWRHSKLSPIGINVYDHSYFLSAEGETTTITIMVRPKNTARKFTSPKKVKSYFSDLTCNLEFHFNLPHNFLVSGVGEGKGWWCWEQGSQPVWGRRAWGGGQGGNCPEPVSLYSLRKSL